MQRILFCLSILIFSLPTFAQKNKKNIERNKTIDSLELLLKNSKEDTNKVIALNNLSHALDAHSEYKKALSYAFNAKQLAKKFHFNNGLADACVNLGNIYSSQGDSPKSLDNYFEALKIYETAHEQKGIAATLGDVGSLYFQQFDFDNSLNYYFRALKTGEDYLEHAKLNNNPVEVKRAKYIISAWLGNIGIVYNEEASEANPDSTVLRDSLFKKAMDYYLKALAMAKEVGDKKNIASAIGNIGIAYDNQGDHEKALDYYFQTLKIQEEVGNKGNIALWLGNIGDLYTETKKYAEAEKYLTDALKIDKEIGTLNNEMENENSLAELYTKTNRFQLALEHYKKSIVLKDTLFNANKNKEITRKEMTYEFDKKEAIEKAEQEKKDAITVAENKKEKIIIGSLVIGSMLVLLFLVFVYRSLRVTRKQKNVIEIKSRETELQKQIIEEKNKDITDSLTYAKRIQHAKLPKKEEIYSALPNSFVLFKPKDIVSGDFYFFHRNNDSVFIAAADCTGHGVPGALMSMIGSDKLEDAVCQSTHTSEILNQLNKGIKTTLRQSASDESTRDGMDIALCSINLEHLIVKYSGANRPLWIIRKGQTILEEIKPTKKAIGGLTDDSQQFETHEIKLHQGDTFYLSTDGFADTFSGKNGKKLMTKRFKEILLSIQDKTTKEQEKHLDNFIENWKAGTEQVDDILVIGVRL